MTTHDEGGAALTSYRIRFRIVASYDAMTPLMHIPIQETVVNAANEVAAKAEIFSWAKPSDSVTIESCAVDPSWTKYHRELTFRTRSRSDER